jgi:phage-related protein
MRRDLYFVGDSLEVLRAFPEEVRHGFGTALRLAQEGRKDPNAKPLKGFGNAGILEISESFAGNTYRAVYTVKLRFGVYLLHCFHKKSTRGIATPAKEMSLVKTRFGLAAQFEKERLP